VLTHLPSALVALLPVLVFLAALLWLDSYKLLAPWAVVIVIGAVFGHGYLQTRLTEKSRSV